MPWSAVRLREDTRPAHRYFIDIDDGMEIPDEIGRQLEPGPAVRAEALRVITTLAAAEAEDAREADLTVNVRDSFGARVLTVRLICQIEEI